MNPYGKYVLRPVRRGAILISMIALIFVSAIVAALFVQFQMRKLRETALDYRRDDLRCTAYSALEMTLAVLHEFKRIDGSLNSPTQGWGSPMDYAQWTPPEGMNVSIVLVDEGAKRSLNAMTEPELITLFESMEIDLYEAQVLAQSLLDWTDKDEAQRPNGAEDDYYESKGLSILAPNRPLRSYGELRWVRGFAELFFDEEGSPNERMTRLRLMTTLQDVKTLNINTASSELVTALLGQDSYTAKLLSDQIAGPDGVLGTDDDTVLKTLPKDANLPNIGTQLELLRVTIFVRRGAAVFRLEALVSPSKSSTNAGNTAGVAAVSYPFTLVELRENASIP